jgi:glycosyltransferase involved in cell wall biosynthesis
MRNILQNFVAKLRPNLVPVSRRRAKHVVVLSQLYPPEPHSFSPDVAAAAAQQGHQVTVITGFPNRPGGKLHPGYRQRFNFVEVIDDIMVRRVPMIINHSHKAVERIANFLSFSLSALTATPKVKTADAVYVYATPATAAIPAQIWRKLYGIPYVLHVQDLWPESVTDSGMLGKGWVNRAAGAILNIWLKRLYGNAAQLIAISPGMKQLLIDRGHRPEQCSTVYNWAEEDTLHVKPPQTFSAGGLQLLYAGNLGPMQDLETVIEAARRLDDQQEFHLNIAGEGVLEEQLRTAAAGVQSVQFLGNLSADDIARRYLEADFQLVTLKDIPIFRTTVPSKLQVSLAVGVPVITTVSGDVAELIAAHNAGIIAEPENPESLAEAFTTAYEMTAEERAQMGINARRLYEDKMSHAAGTSHIVGILDQITHQQARKVLVEETS